MGTPMEKTHFLPRLGIKKRGPFSASDVRASYTQVLRFAYLQKEVDLEIERREDRQEKQRKAKSQKHLASNRRGCGNTFK